MTATIHPTARKTLSLPSQGSKPQPSARAFKPKSKRKMPAILGAVDVPRFFKLAGRGTERRLSVHPCAVGALVAGKDKNEGKTWLIFHNSNQKKHIDNHPKPVLLDVHYAIISYWWHSSFPGSAKTPQAQDQLEREIYQKLKMKFEGAL